MHFTDEQPFLDAIFDRYADDRPRLVYADFLDDAGEPERAELIRVQLALSRLGEDDPRRPQLKDREAELLNRNRAAWTSHLVGLVLGVDFRRGVPDSASVDAATFLERGEELFLHLRIRRLRLLDGKIVVYQCSVLPMKIAARIPVRDLQRQSLYELIMQHACVRDLAIAAEHLLPSQVTEEEARHVSSKAGQDVVRLIRVVGEGSQMVEYSNSILLGPHFSF